MGFENEQALTVEASQEASPEQPRWTVTQLNSTKINAITETLGQTNSATEALELFHSTFDTTITDNTTGRRVGRTEWVRDGSATDWIPSPELVAYAAVEEMGAALPARPAGMSPQDYQLAEALMLSRHYPEPEGFGQTLLNREVQKAAQAAFGESTPGIRSGQLPDDWSGEARARPVVVFGSYEAGTLDDRDPQPGEEPTEWRVEVRKNDQRWEWFANGFSEAEANETSARLNSIASLSQPVASQQQPDQQEYNPREIPENAKFPQGMYQDSGFGVFNAAFPAPPQPEIAYTVQSRRIVPDNAAAHAGENAVYVQLADGRRAWGFGADDDAAEKAAVARAERIGIDADRAPNRAVLHEQPEEPMPSRTYLAVPYAEKNEAKAQGAKWDKEAKSWYAPEGVDVANSGLARWSLDRPSVVKATEPEPVEKQFIAALKDVGLNIDAARDGKPHPVADGKIYRVPTTDDKPGATSGAYSLHMTGKTPGGYIQNHKTGEVVHWKPEGKTAELSAEERARQATEAAQQRKSRENERAEEHTATATAAQALWKEAPAATADNAYCKAKGITSPAGLRVVPASVSAEAAAHGIKIAKTAKEAKELREADPKNRVFKAGDLLIPGADADGKMWTLQSVNPYFKSFMKGGRKHGLFTVAGADDPQKALRDADPKSPLIMGEGYATADTVSRLNGGGPVIVAFDSGNLDAVAKELRERFPQRPLLIAADNDHNAPKQLDANGKPKPNVGLVKAAEVAEKHGCGLIVPQFKDGDKGSDWNDLAATQGDESARRMLAEQMAVAKRDAAVTAERLTTLARTRDMEARNDPTTSADDVKVATERGHAAEVLAGAQSQLSEVRSMAADGVTGNGKGTRSPAAVKAGIDRKTEAMHDKAKDERQDVLNHAQHGPLDGATGLSWKKLPEPAKQAMIEAVKSGREVTLPKDAPAKLKKMAGHEPAPRPRSRGMDADL
ncbi:toprim domain-containing protein [Salmonella enterica]|nr:toprim domain-containing protein [Salmonella enterica]